MLLLVCSVDFVLLVLIVVFMCFSRAPSCHGDRGDHDGHCEGGLEVGGPERLLWYKAKNAAEYLRILWSAVVRSQKCCGCG